MGRKRLKFGKMPKKALQAKPDPDQPTSKINKKAPGGKSPGAFVL